MACSCLKLLYKLLTNSESNMSYRQRPPLEVDHMTSLKVDNITYRTSPEALKRSFERYGDVGDVYIPRDPWVALSFNLFLSWHCYNLHHSACENTLKLQIEFVTHACSVLFVDTKHKQQTSWKINNWILLWGLPWRLLQSWWRVINCCFTRLLS